MKILTIAIFFFITGIRCNFANEQVDEEDYYLSGILYIAPEKWTIWLNNQSVEVLGDQGLYVLRNVHADFIEVELKGKILKVRPNQSFNTRSKKVVDGDLRDPQEDF